MALYLDEFKPSLMEVIDTLVTKDIGYIIGSLNLGSDEVEKQRIITALENFLSALTGDTETLGSHNKKEEERRMLKREYGNNPVNKTVAIAYTNLPKSTFEKKVNIEGIKHIIDGKPYFKIDDLDKIMRLIIDSSKSALCISSHYQFDRKREGFLPFSGGEYYKILDENEKTVWLYNERWKANVAIRRIDFGVYFRVEEEIKF